ncbi:hypothetical protein Avbf_08781 [Armadillidium vulgare]|nr:hypothetical protein Avbf_08781 [Armadillidium vulgare]
MDNIRKIILLYILLKFCTGESPHMYLDGIQLNSVHESLCKDFLNIENLYSIDVCSFVKFLNESLADENENYYVLFSLKDRQSNSFNFKLWRKGLRC